MRFRVPATVVIGGIAIVAATSVYAFVRWHASQTTIDAGFWWDDAPFILSIDDAGKIGGALTAPELATIKRRSRLEVERAFSGLRIDITDDRDAFWRLPHERVGVLALQLLRCELTPVVEVAHQHQRRRLPGRTPIRTCRNETG